MRLRGTIALLLALCVGLTAANFVSEPRPNAVSALDEAAGTAAFELYTLERDVNYDNAGQKKPDIIRGTNTADSGDGTVILTAPRIQEYAALPTALAAVTINENNTSSLEIVPLSGGPEALVPLPEPGTVELLHAASKNLIGFAFSSAPPSRRYWKTLFVYDAEDPSTPPREIRGLDGKPVTVHNWDFVPNTFSLVVQDESGTMFLADALASAKPAPLGLHAEFRGFIPGTKEIHVVDASSDPTNKQAKNLIIDLTSGSTRQLDLKAVIRNDRSWPGATLLLNGSGRYAQSTSENTAGKVTSVLTVTDLTGSETLFRPDPAWARIDGYCLSPDGKFLAVEATAPEGAADHYPVLPAHSRMQTEIVALDSGRHTRSLPGFLPSWCR
ncbi:hypothetical protein ASF98_17205 [Arthrobacter sp. Leaf337]|uniref:hypothetical protein n=1 Tax=Arthrobacter sp. Leaf337 TaxID=1736342 RepID=UPI0006F52542|nr:hypothetical protein [Arthrobacter sp. Leaf337]KQR81114.1 hypothetical protein ASF98_17205 [Arthrobacter sp. Leaf337]